MFGKLRNLAMTSSHGNSRVENMNGRSSPATMVDESLDNGDSTVFFSKEEMAVLNPMMDSMIAEEVQVFEEDCIRSDHDDDNNENSLVSSPNKSRFRTEQRTIETKENDARASTSLGSTTSLTSQRKSILDVESHSEPVSLGSRRRQSDSTGYHSNDGANYCSSNQSRSRSGPLTPKDENSYTAYHHSNDVPSSASMGLSSSPSIAALKNWKKLQQQPTLQEEQEKVPSTSASQPHFTFDYDRSKSKIKELEQENQQKLEVDSADTDTIHTQPSDELDFHRSGFQSASTMSTISPENTIASISRTTQDLSTHHHVEAGNNSLWTRSTTKDHYSIIESEGHSEKDGYLDDDDDSMMAELELPRPTRSIASVYRSDECLPMSLVDLETDGTDVHSTIANATLPQYPNQSSNAKNAKSSGTPTAVLVNPQLTVDSNIESTPQSRPNDLLLPCFSNQSGEIYEDAGSSDSELALSQLDCHHAKKMESVVKAKACNDSEDIDGQSNVGREQQPLPKLERIHSPETSLRQKTGNYSKAISQTPLPPVKASLIQIQSREKRFGTTIPIPCGGINNSHNTGLDLESDGDPFAWAYRLWKRKGLMCEGQPGTTMSQKMAGAIFFKASTQPSRHAVSSGAPKSAVESSSSVYGRLNSQNVTLNAHAYPEELPKPQLSRIVESPKNPPALASPSISEGSEDLMIDKKNTVAQKMVDTAASTRSTASTHTVAMAQNTKPGTDTAVPTAEPPALQMNSDASSVNFPSDGLNRRPREKLVRNRQSLPSGSLNMPQSNNRRKSFSNILQQWKEKSDDKPNTHFLSQPGASPMRSFSNRSLLSNLSVNGDNDEGNEEEYDERTCNSNATPGAPKAKSTDELLGDLLDDKNDGPDETEAPPSPLLLGELLVALHGESASHSTNNHDANEEASVGGGSHKESTAEPRCEQREEGVNSIDLNLMYSKEEEEKEVLEGYYGGGKKEEYGPDAPNYTLENDETPDEFSNDVANDAPVKQPELHTSKLTEGFRRYRQQRAARANFESPVTAETTDVIADHTANTSMETTKVSATAVTTDELIIEWKIPPESRPNLSRVPTTESVESSDKNVLLKKASHRNRSDYKNVVRKVLSGVKQIGRSVSAPRSGGRRSIGSARSKSIPKQRHYNAVKETHTFTHIKTAESSMDHGPNGCNGLQVLDDDVDLAPASITEYNDIDPRERRSPSDRPVLLDANRSAISSKSPMLSSAPNNPHHPQYHRGEKEKRVDQLSQIASHFLTHGTVHLDDEAEGSDVIDKEGMDFDESAESMAARFTEGLCLGVLEKHDITVANLNRRAQLASPFLQLDTNTNDGLGFHDSMESSCTSAQKETPLGSSNRQNIEASPSTKLTAAKIKESTEETDASTLFSPESNHRVDRPWRHDMVLRSVDTFHQGRPRWSTGKDMGLLASRSPSSSSCRCGSNAFSVNDELVEFYLPLMGSTACTCGKRSTSGLKNPAEPTATENILREWQVTFLAAFGIYRGDQLVKAHHRSAGALATALRQYRKKHDMTPYRTKSCGMALSIWSKTCKAFVRSIRKQLIDGTASNSSTKQNPGGLKMPNTLYILSSFLETIPSEFPSAASSTTPSSKVRGPSPRSDESINQRNNHKIGTSSHSGKVRPENKEGEYEYDDSEASGNYYRNEHGDGFQEGRQRTQQRCPSRSKFKTEQTTI